MMVSLCICLFYFIDFLIKYSPFVCTLYLVLIVGVVGINNYHGIADDGSKKDVMSNIYNSSDVVLRSRIWNNRNIMIEGKKGKQILMRGMRLPMHLKHQTDFMEIPYPRKKNTHKNEIKKCFEFLHMFPKCFTLEVQLNYRYVRIWYIFIIVNTDYLY